MSGGTRTVCSRRWNKVFSSVFLACYPDRYTSSEGRRAEWPKRCDKTNKDKDNSKNIVNNDDSLIQKISPKSNKINKNKSCCMTRLFPSFFGKSRPKLPITERLLKRLKAKSNSLLRFALKLLRLVDTMNVVVEIRRQTSSDDVTPYKNV